VSVCGRKPGENRADLSYRCVCHVEWPPTTPSAACERRLSLCMGRILPCPAVLRLRREIGFPVISLQSGGDQIIKRGNPYTRVRDILRYARPVKANATEEAQFDRFFE
jgi:hypothetical protein